MLAADAVVVIGGRAGTLSELSFAWIHGKPIAALLGAGGVAEQYAHQPLDDRQREPIYAANSPEEVLAWLAQVL